MPNNECIPYFEPAHRVTARCTAAVRGKRFVAVSGDITGGPGGTENVRVAEAGAGVKAFGVACYDGVLNEEIPTLNDGAIAPVTSGAAITAGQEVESDATGRAIPLAAGRPCGLAVSSVGAADLDVAIKLYP